MLPASGTISMMQVRAEAGTGGEISLDQAGVRSLAGIPTPSSVISMNDLHGKVGLGPTGPMTVTGNNDEIVDYATGLPFTATLSPSVSVAGGTAPLSFRWVIAIGSSFTLADATLPACRVSHVIGKYGYIGTCTLTCTVSDSGGNTVEKTGITASFDYQQNDGSALP